MASHLTALLWTSHGAQWPAEGQGVRVRAGHVVLDDEDGTIAFLAFEALGRERVTCDVALVAPRREAAGPDALADHRYLQSVAAATGVRFARPGAGPAASLHRRRFAAPGRLLVSSCPGAAGAGAYGTLVLGASPLELALALAGEPLERSRPAVAGVRLAGELPAGAGAVELLDAIAHRLPPLPPGAVIELLGPGVAQLPMRERIAFATLAPARLGASAVFPSDDATREDLRARGRDADWRRFEGGASGFDAECDVELGTLVPPALPAPARVHVGELADDDDLRALARALTGRRVPSDASLEIVPGGRAVRAALAEDGALEALAAAGARVLAAEEAPAIPPDAWVCGAPGTNARDVSLAAIVRAFAGGDAVEVLAARPPAGSRSRLDPAELLEPLGRAGGAPERGAAHRVPAIGEPVLASCRLGVVHRAPGDLRAADVLAWGPRTHALRADALALAARVLHDLDPGLVERAGRLGASALAVRGVFGAGEPADAAARALAALGVRAVFATSFANGVATTLAHEGVRAFRWRRGSDAASVAAGDELELPGPDAHERDGRISIRNLTRGLAFDVEPAQSGEGRQVVLAGGLLARALRRTETLVEGA